MHAAVRPLGMPSRFVFGSRFDDRQRFVDCIWNTRCRRSAVAFVWRPGADFGSQDRIAQSVGDLTERQIAVWVEDSVAAAARDRIVNEPSAEIESIRSRVKMGAAGTVVAGLICFEVGRTRVNRDLQIVDGHLIVPSRPQIDSVVNIILLDEVQYAAVNSPRAVVGGG